MSEDRAIVIVGAGQCGATAAITLREAGHTGRIILVGEERIAPYERPPLSKAALLTERPAPVPVYPPSHYASRAIDLQLGTRVSGIDARRRMVIHETGELPYEQLLLATGGRARQLSASSVNPKAVLTLRTWSDAMSLRARLAQSRHVTIIGGGLIGLECAAAARSLGVEVTVVEAAPRLLARTLPEQMAARVEQLHVQQGVCLMKGATVTRVAPVAHRWRVESRDGMQWVTDLVVAGVGLIANDALAAGAGCAASDGILVDARGATTVPGIFAAGDCARFWHAPANRTVRRELWQHAIRHGAHVARAMLGADEPYLNVAWGWTDQFGVNLQIAGDPAAGSQHAWQGSAAGAGIHFSLHEGQLVGAVAWNDPRKLRAAIRLIGSEVDAGVLTS